jgi:hypothetical protein
MKLEIYSQTNVLKATISPDDSSTHQKGLMDENVLSLSFTHYDCITIDVNDYVDFEGERFTAIERYTPAQKSTVEWAYNLKMYGVESLFRRTLMLKLVDNENSPVFELTAVAHEHIQLIVDNLNRAQAPNVWHVGEVVSTALLVVSYKGTSITAALEKLAEDAQTEWWIDGTTINLSRCQHSEALVLGYHNGLLQLSKDTNENTLFFTRLFPVGSSRNIDRATYGYSRLQLPSRQTYIEQNAEYGIIEYYEEDAFSHIYPRRFGTVGTVRSEEQTGDDGEPFTVYYFTDPTLNFDPNDYMLEGLVITIVFEGEIPGQGGELEGRDFEVNYNSDTHEFEIITQFPYDDGTQLPGGALVPQTGDKYIMYNLRMPQEYITAAEQEYQEAVDAFLATYNIDKAIYKAPTDYQNLGARENLLSEPLLSIGHSVRLESAEFFPETGFRLSRIVKFSRKVNNPLEANIEIGDTVDRGKMATLEGSVANSNYYMTQALDGLPYIIKSWEDNILATDTNLLSARATLRKIAEMAKVLSDLITGKFLRKDIHDTAEELITFLKGIEVFGTAMVENLNVETLAVFQNALSSPSFVSGFPGGTGWMLWLEERLNIAGATEHKAKMEIDDITVRGVMRVYEFVISQLLGENGTHITSDMMRVHHIDAATKTIYLDTDEGVLYNPFRPGDILMCQQFSPEGGLQNPVIKHYELIVATAQIGSLSAGEARLDTITYSAFDGDVSHVQFRDVLCRVDSMTNPDRKGIIKTTSVENGAPYMDVMYGMKTDPDNALKARLGRLTGIVSYLWGQLQGYGLYGENVYLTGEFRMKNGRSVQTQFEVLENMFKSAYSSVHTDVNATDNWLKNATFLKDMEYWERERDIEIYEVGDSFIDFGANLFSEKNKIADIDTFDGRFMLRIKDSFIRQLNADITKPENEEDDVYLTLRYFCTEAGHLTAGFAGTDIYIEQDITPTTVGEFVKIEVSGFWDATGDFEICFTGDIYIDLLSLTTNSLENYKRETNTRFEQTDEAILAEATERVSWENGMTQYINNAGWVTTAQGNTLWASHTEFDALGNRVSTAETNIIQNANNITLKANQSDYDALGQRMTTAESSISVMANQIALKVNQTTFDALGQRVSTAESNISVLSNQISLKASQSDLSALTGRMTTAESTLTVQAGQISSKVSTTDYNGNQIVSMINQTSTTVSINAAHINLNGYTTINGSGTATGFSVESNGTVHIAGFTVQSGWLYCSANPDSDVGYIDMRGTNTRVAFGRTLIPASAGSSITCTAIIQNNNAASLAGETIGLWVRAQGTSSSGATTTKATAAYLDGGLRVKGAISMAEEFVFNVNISNSSYSTATNLLYYRYFVFQGSSGSGYYDSIYLPNDTAIASAFGSISTGLAVVDGAVIRITVIVTRYSTSSFRIYSSSATPIINYDGSTLSYIQLNAGDVIDLIYCNRNWYYAAANFNLGNP